MKSTGGSQGRMCLILNEYVETNIGNILIDEYKDYVAFTLGYDSYAEMSEYESYVIDVSTDTDATQTDAPAMPETADDRLYMSQEYQGKTLDDIYSMLVSTRNAVLLLCFIVFIFEAHKLMKNAMKRHFKS